MAALIKRYGRILVLTILFLTLSIVTVFSVTWSRAQREVQLESQPLSTPPREPSEWENRVAALIRAEETRIAQNPQSVDSLPARQKRIDLLIDTGRTQEARAAINNLLLLPLTDEQALNVVSKAAGREAFVHGHGAAATLYQEFANQSGGTRKLLLTARAQAAQIRAGNVPDATTVSQLIQNQFAHNASTVKAGCAVLSAMVESGRVQAARAWYQQIADQGIWSIPSDVETDMELLDMHRRFADHATTESAAEQLISTYKEKRAYLRALQVKSNAYRRLGYPGQAAALYEVVSDRSTQLKGHHHKLLFDMAQMNIVHDDTYACANIGRLIRNYPNNKATPRLMRELITRLGDQGARHSLRCLYKALQMAWWDGAQGRPVLESLAMVHNELPDPNTPGLWLDLLLQTDPEITDSSDTIEFIVRRKHIYGDTGTARRLLDELRRRADASPQDLARYDAEEAIGLFTEKNVRMGQAVLAEMDASLLLDSGDAWLRLAEAMDLADDPNGAYAYYDYFLKYASSTPENLPLFLQLLSRSDQLERSTLLDASMNRLRAYSDGPSKRRVFLATKDFYQRQRFAMALRLTDHYSTVWPACSNRLQLLSFKAAALGWMGRNSESQAVVEKMLEQFGHDIRLPRVCTELTFAYLQQDNTTAAAALSHWIISRGRIANDTIQSQGYVAIAHAALGDHLTARSVMDSIVSNYPSHPDVSEILERMGRCYYIQGMVVLRTDENLSFTFLFPEAAHYFEILASSNHRLLRLKDTYGYLGHMYSLMGQYVEAASVYEDMLARWPDHENAAYYHHLLSRLYDKMEYRKQLAPGQGSILARQHKTHIQERYERSLIATQINK